MVDQSTIMALRDSISQMIDSKLKRAGVYPRYAVVKEVPNHATSQVLVLINGSADLPENYINVYMNTVHPKAIGDVVRLSGRGSDIFISEVISAGQTYLKGGGLQFILGTTTNAANVNVDTTTGVMARVTSLPGDKINAEKIQVNTDVLKKQTYTWQDRADWLKNHEAPRVAGVMAPDWTDVPGVAQYDAAGNLVGVAYDRIVAYLLPIIADMHERLQVMEERTQAQTSLINRQQEFIASRLPQKD